jgi:hypothetical protein
LKDKDAVLVVVVLEEDGGEEMAERGFVVGGVGIETSLISNNVACDIVA